MPRKISIRHWWDLEHELNPQCRGRCSNCALTHSFIQHSAACSFTHLSLTQLQNETWATRRGPRKSQFSSSLKHWAFSPQTLLNDTCSQFKPKTSFRTFRTSSGYPIFHILLMNRADSPQIMTGLIIIVSCQDTIKNWLGTDISVYKWTIVMFLSFTIL